MAQDPFAQYAVKDDPFAAYAAKPEAPPIGMSALEAGRRSAASGDTEATPESTFLGRLTTALTPLAHPAGAEVVGLMLPGSGELATGARAFSRGVLKPAAQGFIRGAATVADYVSPEAVGVVSPRLANTLRVAQKMRGAIPAEMQAAETAVAGPAAHLDTSIPVRPSELTPEQLRERVFQGSGTPQTRPPNYAPRPTPGSVPSEQGVLRTTTESPLKAPRIEQGAERVGRGQGLTKEQVRQQAGPVLGEAVGEASPILPKQALSNIIDTMKAMPPSEREAYVARATSGKSQWQIENIRRTLEHLGLLVPAAAGMSSLRQMLLSKMGPQQSIDEQP